MRTLITPWPSEARPSSKRKPKIPSIIIPRTSININDVASINHDKIAPVAQNSLSTSITSQLSTDLLSLAPTKSSPLQEFGMDGAAPDILALAELFATLKQTVSRLYATFDELGGQTRKLAYLGPVIQADHQIENARLMLEQQISRQEKSMQEVGYILKNAVCESIIESLKAQIAEEIPHIVAQEIQRRVQQELSKQIPEKLRRQVQGHTREILEVQTVLYNSEARRHNASLRSPCMDAEPLRPLLRPLPSALQSPAYTLKRPFTANNSGVASPVTPFSAVLTPAPTVYPVGSNQVFELVSPAPSPLFPRDMRCLFGLDPGTAKQLLIDYGLETTSISVAPSPKPDQPEVLVDTLTGLNTPETSPALDGTTTREEDISKFMNHIGLPFLMVPVPKPKSGPQLHLVIPRGS